MTEYRNSTSKSQKLQKIISTNKELGALVRITTLTIWDSLSHMKQKLIRDSSNDMVAYYTSIIKKEKDIWLNLKQEKNWKKLFANQVLLPLPFFYSLLWISV